MHHITLRVDDIDAALAQLKARGIRLIDEQPRPGAEGALVAFIHPSAAHGVLVELKQPAPKVEMFTTVGRHTLGDLELITLSDGFFGLDGGAMFGVVPKPLWEKRLPPDDSQPDPAGDAAADRARRRGTMIIDAGLRRQDGREAARDLRLDRRYHLDHALAEAGLSADDIDIVARQPPALRSRRRLHRDRRRDGALVPRFPDARNTSRIAASGRMPRIRTSATAPATCRTTSCRSRTPAC